MKNELLANESLKFEDFIASNNGMYRLIMQGDGNLVMYDIFNKALWASGTMGKGGNVVTMQGDGNLVIYAGSKAVWASGTMNKGGVKLAMQDDRNLVIYTQDGKSVWASNTNIYINYSPSWMQDNLSTLKSRKLNEICITGSHDSGSSVRNDGTPFSNDCNTKTQSNSIFGQLCYGARYFDIRPVIHNGNYYTGHYANLNIGEMIKDLEDSIFDQTKNIPIVGPWIKKNLKRIFPSPPDAITWQGANGQSFDSIIDDINKFTESYHELIILNLSHAYNTDVGNSNYTDFNQNEWNGLFKKLSSLSNLLYLDETTDITSLPLEDFISSKSAVIVIIDCKDVNIGEYLGKGFYNKSSFNVVNKYSATNNFSDMLKKQVDNMNNNKGQYFLLSWTLSQDNPQIAKCIVPNKVNIPVYGNFKLFDKTSIIDLANLANENLSAVEKFITPDNKPNIIYIDNIQDNRFVNLAMKINTASKYIGESTLQAGNSLSVGQFLASSNGAYKLIMQGDGNLVMYNIFGYVIWASGTMGKGGNSVAMQRDGNLVIYAGGKAVWASGTMNKGGVKLVLQDDRNLVIYTNDGKSPWASGTMI